MIFLQSQYLLLCMYIMRSYKKQLHNHHLLIVKCGISFLLVALLFLLFVSDHHAIWFPTSLVQTTTTKADLLEPYLPISSNATTTSSDDSSISNITENFQVAEAAAAKCDIWVGDWVPDPSGPLYTNESCMNIEAHQNCMKNGRPDTGFLYWRWSPRDCELPKFDPNRFLSIVKDKSWAFIGDSISRNHVQSLLCILSQVEEAVEVYHDEEYKSKRWHFAVHNFTLSVIWSPLIVKADIYEDINGVSSSEIQLHLDKLDTKWTGPYGGFDYVVIAGGKWFLKTAIYLENGTVAGCHYCPAEKNLTELGFDYAYRKALKLVMEFVTTNSKHGAMVFFRAITPDHFENGEWFSGGTCNRTIPFKEEEIEMKDVDIIMRDIEVEELEKARTRRRVTLKLLDTARLSLLRPDGHPGLYNSQYQVFADEGTKDAVKVHDCLHWCLPGPIDSWNDLLMEMIVSGRQ